MRVEIPKKKDKHLGQKRTPVLVESRTPLLPELVLIGNNSSPPSPEPDLPGTHPILPTSPSPSFVGQYLPPSIPLLSERPEVEVEEESPPFQNEDIVVGNKKWIQPTNFREAVAKAAIVTKIPRTAVNTWLHFLSPFGDLPLNYKTLLKTSRETDVETIDGCSWYKPSCSLEIILALEDTEISAITLDLHVDGIPIGSKEMWPVTAFIREINRAVLLVVYEGDKKPQRKDLLKDICLEIKEMMQMGLPVGDRKVSVKFGNLICDAPARALVLNTVSHNATYACFLCWAKSGRKLCRKTRNHKERSRPTFPVSCEQKRSDAEFRSKLQFSVRTNETHHRSTEKLEIESLDIDILKSTPIDYMHTVLLGVVRNQLLSVWKVIVPSFINKLDECLKTCKTRIPDEFPRKCRSYRDDWKATEFRLFLLYLGPLILRDILSEEQYIHFMKLSIAMRILCSDVPRMLEKIDLAKKLMSEFVTEYEILYPNEPLTYNLHMSNHLPDCCKDLQMNVDQFSAFKGENFLQRLKNYYDRGPNPLKQIIKRFSEERVFEDAQTPLKNFECRLEQQIDQTNFYKKCLIKNFTIGIVEKNAFVKAQQFILAIHSIEHRGNLVVFRGYPCQVIKDAFIQPTPSRDFGIYIVRTLQNSNLMEFTNRDISNKFVCIPQQNNMLGLIELLHGNEVFPFLLTHLKLRYSPKFSYTITF